MTIARRRHQAAPARLMQPPHRPPLPPATRPAAFAQCAPHMRAACTYLRIDSSPCRYCATSSSLKPSSNLRCTTCRLMATLRPRNRPSNTCAKCPEPMSGPTSSWSSEMKKSDCPNGKNRDGNRSPAPSAMLHSTTLSSGVSPGVPERAGTRKCGGQQGSGAIGWGFVVANGNVVVPAALLFLRHCRRPALRASPHGTLQCMCAALPLPLPAAHWPKPRAALPDCAWSPRTPAPLPSLPPGAPCST